MNLRDFEKIANVREQSLEKEGIAGLAAGLGKKFLASMAKDPAKAAGHGLNAYFVGGAPIAFNQAMSRAKQVPIPAQRTF